MVFKVVIGSTERQRAAHKTRTNIGRWLRATSIWKDIQAPAIFKPNTFALQTAIENALRSRVSLAGTRNWNASRFDVRQ
jgi:hypothetical protein